MANRRKPTSVLQHEKDRLEDAVFVACREGHIHDLKKLKPKLDAAKRAYEERLKEDEALQQEKDRKRAEREEKRRQKNAVKVDQKRS